MAIALGLDARSCNEDVSVAQGTRVGQREGDAKAQVEWDRCGSGGWDARTRVRVRQRMKEVRKRCEDTGQRNKWPVIYIMCVGVQRGMR